jgi:hypothetical protein
MEMIYETLQILKEQLENYFVETGLGKIIVLDNIALWESGSTEASRIEGKVVLTLLKLEEEATLNNNQNLTLRDSRAEQKNSPVFLNIYLLISANCDTYDKSLSCISKTIEFFQGKMVFTNQNTVYNRTNVALGKFDEFRFNLRLYTPTFEEMNNIWGTLGGRQLPFVIYKVQLIQISQDKTISSTGVITHIGGTLKDYDK